MTRYAKITNNVVDLIFDGETPPFFERFFETDADGNQVLKERVVGAGWEAVPSDVMPGWQKQPDGSFVSPPPPVPPTAEEIEAEAQGDLKAMTEDLDTFVAFAWTVVKLVKFTADNPAVVRGLTEQQIFQRFKDEALTKLRERKTP